MLLAVIALLAGVAIGLAVSRRKPPPTPPQRAASSTAELEYLKASNALLRTLAGSPDIVRSLFELAGRIRAIVPCDRVGLALLTEDGEGYSTYTARLDDRVPAAAADADLHFPRQPTVIDEVVTTRQPRLVEDVASLAPSYLDANVVRSAGFTSFVLLPLVFEGAGFGTLHLVSRRRAAFSEADVHTLRPVADALASAFGTRRLATALTRHQLANELSELTFAFANDMSGAVQAIIGQSELIARKSRDHALDRDVAAMLQQARRLRDIVNNMQRMTREHVATSSRPQ